MMLDNRSAKLLLVKTIKNTLLNPRSSLHSEIFFQRQQTTEGKPWLVDSLAAFLSLRQDELGEVKRVPRAGPLYLQHLVSTMAAKSAQADLYGQIHDFFKKKRRKRLCACEGIQRYKLCVTHF